MDATLGTFRPWLIGGLAAYSLCLTLLTSWFVARLWGGRRQTPSVLEVLGQLVWAAAVFAAGWLTIRYTERISYPALGYVTGIVLTAMLSIIRAVLSQAAARSQSRGGRSWQALARGLLHELTYVMTAIAASLLVSILFRARVDPRLFIPLAVGAVLPGVLPRPRPAEPTSQPPGQGATKVSLRPVRWHSLGAGLLVAIVTLPLMALGGVLLWATVPAGYVVHLLVDMARPSGILLLWPLSMKRYHILGGALGPAQGSSEQRYTAVLAAVLAVALFVADVGPPRAPAVVQPSYDQTLERYYGMRGRRLVYADLSGSWQASGRRLYGRFEVLNARGRSYVLLERYSGRVFTGGREAEDHVYLDSITLVPGAPARIKPVEFPLNRNQLSEVLPTVYEMQSEPGLQHIYVSGEIILESEQPATRLEILASDYSQTEVRRFERLGERHYRLNYVPAAQLIGLAKVSVEAGSLLVVATYESQPSGPTATPLPVPPAQLP